MQKILLFTITTIALLQHDTMLPLKIKKNLSPFYDQRSTRTKKFDPTFIIIHFTANCSQRESWRAFFNFLRPVSAHYLINIDGLVEQMVPDDKRAWHTGDSFWQGNTDLNRYSIGIEIIDPGSSKPNQEPCSCNQQLWNTETGIKISGSDNLWYPFTEAQIASVIELCHKLIKKYNIPAHHILGHSDIAPGRKIDPGPLFPWKKLAEQGIGLWWNDDGAPAAPFNLERDLASLQKKLAQFGYNIKPSGQLDDQTKKVVQAFQMHFEQDNISGIPDEQTLHILENLLKQIRKQYLTLKIFCYSFDHPCSE